MTTPTILTYKLNFAKNKMAKTMYDHLRDKQALSDFWCLTNCILYEKRYHLLDQISLQACNKILDTAIAWDCLEAVQRLACLCKRDVHEIYDKAKQHLSLNIMAFAGPNIPQDTVHLDFNQTSTDRIKNVLLYLLDRRIEFTFENNHSNISSILYTQDPKLFDYLLDKHPEYLYQNENEKDTCYVGICDTEYHYFDYLSLIILRHSFPLFPSILNNVDLSYLFSPYLEHDSLLEFYIMVAHPELQDCPNQPEYVANYEKMISILEYVINFIENLNVRLQTTIKYLDGWTWINNKIRNEKTVFWLWIGKRQKIVPRLLFEQKIYSNILI